MPQIAGEIKPVELLAILTCEYPLVLHEPGAIEIRSQTKKTHLIFFSEKRKQNNNEIISNTHGNHWEVRNSMSQVLFPVLKKGVAITRVK